MNDSTKTNENWKNFQLKDYILNELSFNVHSQNFSNSKDESANLIFDTQTRLFDDTEKVNKGEITFLVNINVEEARKGNAAFDMTAVMIGLFSNFYQNSQSQNGTVTEKMTD